MKRVFSFFFVALILLSSCSVIAHAEAADSDGFTPVSAKLIVAGNVVSDDQSTVIYTDAAQEFVYCELPLIATLKALNAVVVWVNPQKALILYGGFVMQLDTGKGSVYFISPEQNYFNLLGGGSPHPQVRRQEGKEYIVDSTAAGSLFKLLQISMRCDTEQAQVVVEREGRAPGVSFVSTILLFFLAALVQIPWVFGGDFFKSLLRF